MSRLNLYERLHGERQHTGDAIILKPDTFWCSDGFEIRCWNREVVRVVFSLDCCDREVTSWLATTGGINSVLVQDLLTESVEKCFFPHAVECLTDNGSCYTLLICSSSARDASGEQSL
ncbi:DDE-type integrase/transposase/recombinase [Pectobacterium brasiliense]|uniref:DDE-type integrase/transposase/recombinase n=1 Tax=Pectobacterium brasiliense TaxID=180957 RepID=UPI003F804782